MSRILLVEDDLRLAQLVKEYLEREGYHVSVEGRGDRAVERVFTDPPDVVVLDLRLPGEDGLSACRRMRTRFSGPILMLTARSEETDAIVGLEVGADDYVAKPASPRLLLARIRALLRRRTEAPRERVEVGGLQVDRAAREARIDGVLVELTSAEFDLLWLLAVRAGEPVPREELLRDLRGIDWDGLDRSIDVRVSQLRRKLAQDPRHRERIKTVRGLGYQLAVDLG